MCIESCARHVDLVKCHKVRLLIRGADVKLKAAWFIGNGMSCVLASDGEEILAHAWFDFELGNHCKLRFCSLGLHGSECSRQHAVLLSAQGDDVSIIDELDVGEANHLILGNGVLEPDIVGQADRQGILRP